MVKIRGLTNLRGENHCFLNVVLQAFWNLSSFQHRFSDYLDNVHTCATRKRGDYILSATPNVPFTGSESAALSAEQKYTEDGIYNELVDTKASRDELESTFATKDYWISTGASSSKMILSDQSLNSASNLTKNPEEHDICVFCMMKNLFAHFTYGASDFFSPSSVRWALSRELAVQNRFAIGDMEDADETLEVLLEIIHRTHLLDAEKINFKTSVGYASAHNFSEFVCNPKCIAHEVFSMELIDIPRCLKCGHLGEPYPFASFRYRIYVSELLKVIVNETASKNAASATANPYSKGHFDSFNKSSVSFGECIKALYQQEQHRGVTPLNTSSELNAENNYDALDSMPSSNSHRGVSAFRSYLVNGKRATANCQVCNSRSSCVSERYCITAPEVFVCSLVWPNELVSSQAIADVLAAINPFISLKDIFEFIKDDKLELYGFSNHVIKERRRRSFIESHNDSSPRSDADDASPRRVYSRHIFRGMVCYYGRHYVAFFFNWEIERWVLFDDSTMLKYLTWSDVMWTCKKGKYMPCILFFENSNSLSTIYPNFINKKLQNFIEKVNRESSSNLVSLIRRNWRNFWSF